MSLLRSIFSVVLLCNAAIASQPAPAAEDIVKRAIQRAKADEEKQLKPFVWQKRIQFAKLDKSGIPEEQADQLFLAALIDGERKLIPLTPEGKPLNDDQVDQSDLAKRVRDEQHKAKPGEKKSEDSLELSEELANRFRFTLVGREPVNGRESYVLTFLPRADRKLPERKHIDKVVNRLQGKLWIDAEHFSLSKADVHLTETASFFGGLGSLRRLDMTFDFVMIEPEVFAPKNVEMFVEGRRLFSSFRVKQASEYSDYKRAEQTAHKQ